MNIRSKLVSIFLIISLVPVFTLGTISYFNTESEITRNTLNNLEVLASAQEKGVQTVIEQNMERLASFNTRVQMKIELDNYNKNGDVRSQEFMNSVLTGIKSQITDFRKISILNAEGVVVASTDSSEIGADHTGEEFFVIGKDRNEVTIFFRDEDQKPGLYLTGPLTVDGNLLGVIAVMSDVTSLYDITGNQADLGKTGESYLVKRNQNGDALLISPLRFNPDSALTKVIPKEDSNSPSIRALSQNEQTFTDTIDYRGIPVLAATRYIEQADWGLVVKIDKAEAFASLEHIKYFTVIISTVVGALIVISSLILSKSISNPITELKKQITEASKGNFDKIQVKSNDEVGELAADFDKMREINYDLGGKNISLQVLNDLLEGQKKQLIETEKAEEEFTAMITHELKTPLVPILGFSELLLDGSLGPLTDQQRENIQIIHESAASLSRLISDLLDVRKLELGEMKFNMADTSANSIIALCINTLKPLAKQKDISLVYHKQPVDLMIKCDIKRIQQVLNNLISNAIKFVPEHEGKIEVAVRNDDIDGFVLFSVKDNGIGIPKEKYQNLFKKFYQVDTSLSRNVGGTGLGLAISKGIVEAHKGKIWLESEIGVGSTFYFSVPTSKKIPMEEKTHEKNSGRRR